ncbi:MAG: glyoxalase/bleomycin resistance/dioxygenase family protein, partial [Acetatifactor sp.]|nr:glyoxalase/bleomycin resistance/dioxygenase family protein [Acetatifactor sp.]
MIKYCNTLLAVQDMARSLGFYKDLFEQEVVVDLGKNKTLACGLVLQEDLDHIAGFAKDTMKFCSNT